MATDYFSASGGTVTLQFPHETIPVPDHGRYKLHNEIEDCIVCDKCAKVCPVNCIEIVPIRSPEVYGHTSDGTPLRIHAEKFDIDMSKCMFCGLCTTVCPTECLTMTSEYDYSTYDIKDHLFPFGKMTEKEILEKQQSWELHQNEKTTLSKEKVASTPKPAIKPAIASKDADSKVAIVKPKPVFRPKVVTKKPPKND